MGANWWKTSGCASGFSAFAIGFRSRQNSAPGSCGMCSTPSLSWAPVGIPPGSQAEDRTARLPHTGHVLCPFRTLRATHLPSEDQFCEPLELARLGAEKDATRPSALEVHVRRVLPGEADPAVHLESVTRGR